MSVTPSCSKIMLALGCFEVVFMSAIELQAQPIDATQALNLSAGVSNCKVSRGHSFS